MPIDIPSISEIQQRIIGDLILSINSGQLDTSKQIDPTIRNSVARGIVDAMAAGFDENNDVLNQILIQIFPQTATDEFLELWASLFGISRKSAVKAGGFIVFEGTASASIPASTALQSANGIGYTTVNVATILSQTISVTSITRSGSTATVTTTSNHNLATGCKVSITNSSSRTAYPISEKWIVSTTPTRI